MYENWQTNSKVHIEDKMYKDSKWYWGVTPKKWELIISDVKIDYTIWNRVILGQEQRN